MASRGINKVILVGNLGQDPETKYTPNGSAVTTISIATSDSWKDKNTGEMNEKTEWHRVVFFGKLAEVAGEYLRKGSQVYVEGKLKTRKWQDNSGQDKYTTEVVVDSFNGVMQMLGGRNENRGTSAPGSGGQMNQSAATNNPTPDPQTSQSAAPAAQAPPAAPPDSSFDDDIPF